jgi:hypothetical protein
MSKIIISQPWGGLGDNLHFSTLPELFSKKGHEVYISENNAVRNAEIFDLVWSKNPYVKGVINDRNGTVVGSNMQHMWPHESQNEYSMHRVEIAHGFQRENFYPKIYYVPKYIEDLKNHILVDLTGASQLYEMQKYIEYIEYFIPLIKCKGDKPVKIITYEKINVNKIFDEVYKYLRCRLPNIEELKITNLINYCDIINSCNTIIIVNSGVNSLAAAIKQDNLTPDIICYNPWTNFSQEAIKGCYNYKNVVYFQSKI